LEAEREAELERSREIARREAALSAAGTEAQIRALEQTLLANATSESNRRVRSLETQLAALVGDVARTQAEAVALRAERAALTEQIEMTERQLSEELVTYGQLRNAFERQQQMLERANHRSTRRDWAFFLGGAAISLITFVLGTR
jgi:Tfp pilus assembly PilM family ATPase